MADKLSLAAQFGRFDDHWSPKIVATLNDYDLKVVKVQGEFVWHQHDETDELFLATAGQLRIHLQDRDDVILGAGRTTPPPVGTDELGGCGIERGVEELCVGGRTRFTQQSAPFMRG